MFLRGRVLSHLSETQLNKFFYFQIQKTKISRQIFSVADFLPLMQFEFV
jgi:hypothetical protein